MQSCHPRVSEDASHVNRCSHVDSFTMSDQQESSSTRSSQVIESTKEAAADYVPGGSIFVLVKDASGAQRIKWIDDDTTTQQDTLTHFDDASFHTPDEKTRLMVKRTIEETPPFVACFGFCLSLNILLACLFLGILVVYLHYRFGFTTPSSYEQELCNYMRLWNRKLLWLVVAVGCLGFVDLLKFCVVLHVARDPNLTQDAISSLGSTQRRQDLRQTAQTIMPCWITTRSVVKYTIDVIYVVWMIQAFWKTNVDVPNMQECPNMYTFTHVYSSIITVIAVLGILSASLLWCLVKLLRGKSNNTNTVEMDV